MPGALEAGVIRYKRLAAPDRSVRAIGHAVQGNPNHHAIQVIFRHARSDVRVMMLHTN